MDDGIYSIFISSKNEPLAEGIVVLNGRNLNGGGRGYLFRGECDQQGDVLNCENFSYRQDKATILRHPGNASSDKTDSILGHFKAV
jgi:T3SS negative regulator,GrlR